MILFETGASLRACIVYTRLKLYIILGLRTRALVSDNNGKLRTQFTAVVSDSRFPAEFVNVLKANVIWTTKPP